MMNRIINFVLIVLAFILLSVGIYSFYSIPHHMYFSDSRNISADSRIDEVSEISFDNATPLIQLRERCVRLFIQRFQLERLIKNLFAAIWLILSITILIPSCLVMESIVKQKLTSVVSEIILRFIHCKDGKKSSLCNA